MPHILLGAAFVLAILWNLFCAWGAFLLVKDGEATGAAVAAGVRACTSRIIMLLLAWAFLGWAFA
jgi:hypothetical protein